jgi:hypothetical protein
MVWRWVGVVVGIVLCLVDFGFNLLGPTLHGIAEVAKDNVKFLGYILIGICIRKEMVPGIVRLTAAAFGCMPLLLIVRGQVGFIQPTDQVLWLIVVTCAVIAMSAWIPRKLRKHVYGIALAFAWVTAGTTLIDGFRGHGGRVFGGLCLTAILTFLTAIYQSWSRTGYPPTWFLHRMKIDRNDAQLFFEEGVGPPIQRPVDEGETEARTVSA